MELVAAVVLFAGVPVCGWLLASRGQWRAAVVTLLATNAYWKARALAWEAYALKQERELADAREAARALGGVVDGICSCGEVKSEERL